MTKIIMCGCNGKMGTVISELVQQDTEIEIVAGVDVIDNGKKDYPVYKKYADIQEEADVIIDFSSPVVLQEMLDYAVKSRTALVLCATGYNEKELQLIEATSKKTAILRSANMSLGINTIVKVLKNISSVLADAGYDIEIVEKHHNQKLDAPSGTALVLADAINSTLDEEYLYKYDRTKEKAKRLKNEIGISAVRGGTIVGEHEVIYAGVDEVIEIKHTAYSKAVFGKGAIQAAKYLKGKPAALYQMSDVIG